MSEKVLAGRYEIIEKIGDGGMAVVYKGRDRLLNRFVAIKILKPEYSRDATFVDSFKKESHAAAGLSHPNIVNIYDVGKEGNIQYIVMELVEGETLSDLIKREAPLDYRLAISIAKQIASALSVAHENNIIHRDVKPHNILMKADGTAKITDFGIAKAVSDATIVGKTDAVMGSVHYFSPEQARGGYVDDKSDIYSLGIVLYEMLTGKVPFDADNPVTVAIMHMNENIVPPSHLVAGIPPALEQIVMKATEKYQINRFKSADEMYEALDNVNFISGIIENPVVADLLKQNGNNGYEYDGNHYYGEEPEEFDEKKMKKENKKNGKKKKDGKSTRLRVIAIILALACAIPVSFLVFNLVSGIGAPKEVVVPNLENLTEQQARDALAELKLQLEVKDRVASFEVDEGCVVSQDPRADRKVKEGSTVKVNLSKGEPNMTEQSIPNLVGKTLDEAKAALKALDYVVGEITYTESKFPKDYVVSHTPEANEEKPAGTTVNLVLSQGEEEEEETVSMPSLIGLTESGAEAELKKIGLVLGATSSEVNATYEKGTVIWQQYAKGDEVPKNSKVNIKISAGATTNEPRTVPITIDYSQAPEEVFTLTVTLVNDAGSKSDVISEAVRYKSNGSEVATVKGTGKGTVYIYFSGQNIAVYSVDFATGEVS